VSNDALDKAVRTLREGGLVAMPTETVYGLAADAKNPEALRKIFHAKGRPMDHPLIVHVADISQLNEWAVDVSDDALRLAEAFWPGPLTLILKKASSVSDSVTGGQETVGIRIPKHPVALALLSAFGGGVAAPSANRFGKISPTTALAVKEELGDKVDCILEGGQCEVGVESTIVDVSGDSPRILRPGMITAAQIESVLQKRLSVEIKNAPRVSGALESHYAPRTPLVIVETQELRAVLAAMEVPVAVLLRKEMSGLPVYIHCVLMSDDPEVYAHDLYAALRQIDKGRFHRIIVEAVSDEPIWDAIRDRLKRAAAMS
jgi:L-threonylcarbamoyladenylate synthase